MTPTLLCFCAWILVGLLTYAFIRFSKWSNDVFQYNLRVEGCSKDVIHIFAILFGLGWPLWWLVMFPISLLIGKHGPKWFEMQKQVSDPTLRVGLAGERDREPVLNRRLKRKEKDQSDSRS